jgi:nucleoside-diphosphate-sugar epimerase
METYDATIVPERLGLTSWIISQDDQILITGANGFIGQRLVANLVGRGFRNLRCFLRPSSSLSRSLAEIRPRAVEGSLQFMRGNLLSPDDCLAATENARVIFHLAAARGQKSFPAAYSNSVVTTRNLLEASLHHRCLLRFVNVSSFAVYANDHNPRRGVLDESGPIEVRPELRGEAYCYAKVKQDEMLIEYGKRFRIPYVIVRPGHVFGPGNQAITGRVGIGTFGLFLHLGGFNRIPFTYVDNCADAIVLSGLTKDIDGEIFNVVDDELPSSREFLRLYKRHVRQFPSLYLPHAVSYMLCYAWERYSNWSDGQLPPVFNRRRWRNNWKKTGYTNQKLKERLGWRPKVRMADALTVYFEACRAAEKYA